MNLRPEEAAAQYLRLLDQRRRLEAADLLAGMDDRELAAVGAVLARVAADLGDKLPSPTQRTAAARRRQMLAEQLRADAAVDGAARFEVFMHGAEALRVMTELWPGRAKRRQFCEAMAGATFDA